MSKQKVIVYMRDDAYIEQLKVDFDVVSFHQQETISDPAFVEALRDAEGIIGLQTPVDEALLELAPSLKVVSNISVGYDNLDIDALHSRNVYATNTPGILDNTTADAIFALLLATARRVAELDHLVKSGQWDFPIQPSQYGVDVHHKTLGIIGLGNIGKAIAKRAHLGFDMNILYHNRSRHEDVEQLYGATYCSMDELLTQADFVCLMVPATKDTVDMMSSNEFNKMKSSAIFINGSRGQNVDEDALYHALSTGVIHAAGIDVFKVEPTSKDNPLLTLNNIVTLPHLGSSTTECELAMTQLAVTNLREGLAGKQPRNAIL